jgi:Fic family protein
MREYAPPFTLSAQAVSLIADIAALTERFTLRMEQPDALLLRRANKIKSIRSSLAIEGNTLSEDQVSDILDGKPVVAPIRQIQEVKNAIDAYDLYPKLNPFSVKDLLRAHKVMMTALMDAPGQFRNSGVGVMAGADIIHLAPPAARVPVLMGDLFGWLKKAPDHLLVKSCVFHYEFEFIHPFADGNGRMGRLWQSLILGRWNPVFRFLPVENMVHASQQTYYDAIAASSRNADCGPFIDFMLGEICKTLESRKGEPLSDTDAGFTEKFTDRFTEEFTEKERAILLLIKTAPSVTTSEMAVRIGVSRQTIAKTITALKQKNILRRIGSDKDGHWEIIFP